MTNEKKRELKVTEQDVNKWIKEGVLCSMSTEGIECKDPDEIVLPDRLAFGANEWGAKGAQAMDPSQRPMFFVDEASVAAFKPMEINTISFNNPSGGEPILRLEDNGDIFVHGRLAENDKEVVQGMRDFLKGVR